MTEHSQHEAPTLPQEKGPTKPRGWFRRVVGFVAKVLGGLLVLLALILLLLQTPWGAKKGVTLALRLFNPFVEATVDIGQVRGNFLTDLSLHDVALFKNDGTRLVQIDTVATRIRLFELFSRRLHLYDTRLTRPLVTLSQRADSTWDLLNVLPPPAEDDTTSGTFEVLVESARLTEGRSRLHFFSPGKDSILHVDDLNLYLGSLHLAEDLTVEVDTLWGWLLFDETDAAHLRLSASLQEQRFTLNDLSFTSSLSEVTGQGTLLLPTGEHTPFDEADFTLSATPLAFRDIRPFLPSLAPKGQMRLNLQASGTGALMAIDASASFSDGSSLDLQAKATPTLNDSVAYELNGTVRHLDPQLFAYDVPTLAGQINASLRADLRGPTIDSLNGFFRTTLQNTYLGDFAFDSTAFASTFRAGTATVNLQTGLRNAILQLGGTTRPLDALPFYDFRGKLQHLDIAQFLQDTTLTSDLNTSFTLAGNTFDLPDAEARFIVNVEPSRLGNVYAGQGLLEASLAGALLDFETSLNLGRGRLMARGNLDLSDTLRYRIEEGTLENLNLTALLEMPTSSNVNATFSMHGEGSDPATLRLDAVAQIDSSTYDTYTLTSARLTSHLENGQLVADAEARLQGGGIQTHLEGRPFDEIPTLALTEGRFDTFDFGTLLQLPDQQSDLNGTFEATMQHFDPAAMLLDAQLTLAPSRLNQQEIRSGNTRIDFQEGQFQFAARLAMPEGTTTLNGSAQPFLEPPVFALQRSTFEGLNIGALTGVEALHSDLNGSLSLNGYGTTPETMGLQARVNFNASTLNAAALENGFIETALNAGEAHLNADLNFDAGNVVWTATGRFFDEQIRYETHAAVTTLDLDRLAGIDTLEAELTLRIDAEGEGLDPQTMRLHARVEADSSFIDQALIRSMLAEVHVEEGLATVQSLEVLSNVGVIYGSGDIALTDPDGDRLSDFTLDARVTDLSPLASLIGARMLAMEGGMFTTQFFGDPGVLHFETDAAFKNFILDDIRLVSFEGTIQGDFNPDRSLGPVGLRADMGLISMPFFVAEQAHMDASYATGKILFDGGFSADQRRSGHLAGQIDLTDSLQVITLKTLDIVLGTEAWSLLQQATITLGDAYRVSNFLLYTEDQQIALDGVIDLNGDQNVVLSIEQFRIGAVADLFGFSELDGRLNGYLDLTGPAQAPRMNGYLGIDVISGGGTASGTANLAYADRDLNLDVRLNDEVGNSLTLNGTLPMNLSLVPPEETETLTARRVVQDEVLDLEIATDQFSIKWTRGFLDPALIDRLEGMLTADVTIRGSWQSPILTGTASVENGLFRSPLLGATYTGIQLEAAMEDEIIQLTRAEMTSGPGRADASGQINLSKLSLGEYDIEVRASDFEVIRMRDLHTVAGANLNLSGTTSAPVVRGDVQVVRANIFLVDESRAAVTEPVQLSETELATLERRFGVRVSASDTTTFDIYEAMRLDLKMRIDRETWLRSRLNPRMDIQFTGELDVQKAPFQDLQVFGDIQVIPDRSRLNYLGRKFQIERGTLAFNGPPTDPLMDIQTVYDVPTRSDRTSEVTIRLLVQGRFEDMNFQLSSEPQMDNTDIVSYLVFGRPANESLALGGGTAGMNAGAAVVANQVSAFLGQLAGLELGLDVMEIELDPLRGTVFTIGKYITPRFYAAVSQPITATAASSSLSNSSNQFNTEVTLEYALYRTLLLRMLTLQGTKIHVSVQWELSY